MEVSSFSERTKNRNQIKKVSYGCKFPKKNSYHIPMGSSNASFPKSVVKNAKILAIICGATQNNGVSLDTTKHITRLHFSTRLLVLRKMTLATGSSNAKIIFKISISLICYTLVQSKYDKDTLLSKRFSTLTINSNKSFILKTIMK